MTTKEKIEIMQAFVDGKQIQARILNSNVWIDITAQPTWDWERCDYRIKPEPKEPTYRPYKDFAEFRADWEKHGGWVYSRLSETIFLHSTFDDMEFTLNNYVWAEDGSPCGVLIEKGGEA